MNAFARRSIVWLTPAWFVLSACAAESATAPSAAPQPAADVVAADSSPDESSSAEPAVEVAAPDDTVDARSSTVIAADVPAASAGNACDIVGDPGLVSTRRDQLYLVEKIQYDLGKATVRDGSFAILDTLAGRLCQQPSLVIEIGVHTDARGSSFYNLKLSQERAEAVRQYLLEKGISPRQVQAHGYGETRPIADADPAEQRRTEFRIITR